MPFFNTVFCNEVTLHGESWKASATHQSHCAQKSTQSKKKRLVAIQLKWVHRLTGPSCQIPYFISWLYTNHSGVMCAIWTYYEDTTSVLVAAWSWRIHNQCNSLQPPRSKVHMIYASDKSITRFTNNPKYFTRHRLDTFFNLYMVRKNANYLCYWYFFIIAVARFVV